MLTTRKCHMIGEKLILLATFYNPKHQKYIKRGALVVTKTFKSSQNIFLLLLSQSQLFWQADAFKFSCTILIWLSMMAGDKLIIWKISVSERWKSFSIKSGTLHIAAVYCENCFYQKVIKEHQLKRLIYVLFFAWLAPTMKRRKYSGV